MSGEDRRMEAPQDAPWSLQLLADLHAGALDDAATDELLTRARRDPEARAVLEALDSTAVELSRLPPPELPDDVASRLGAALDQELRTWSQGARSHPETAPPAPPEIHTATGRDRTRRRRRRIGASAGIVAAAAALAGIFVFSSTLLTPRTEQQAVPPPAPEQYAPMTLRGEQVTLTSSQFSQVMRSDQYGSLSDPTKLIGCLRANGISHGKPMGARSITLNGRPAQLLVLPTGKIGQFRLLAVGPRCGPGSPATLSSTVFGG